MPRSRSDGIPWRKAAYRSGIEHAPCKFGPSLGEARNRHPGLTRHRPVQTRAELRFPPFAHRAFDFSEDRRRGRSVENARSLSLSSEWGQPDCGSSEVIRNRPLPTRKPTPLDLWHGDVGVIHALSTATIPSQSSRGGQRVGNPHDDLGRSLFQTLREAARTEHRPIQSARVATAAGSVRGSAPALRGGGGEDVAAAQGLAADRAGRSGGGARQVAAAAGGDGLDFARQRPKRLASCPRCIRGAGSRQTKGAVSEGWALRSGR